jgi:pyruvate formate lyase activating enzyme
MLDYPGQIASVLFVGNCNWKCSFCHIRDLSKLKPLDFNVDILPKLLKRKKGIDHVIITGGEPTTYGNQLLAVVKQLHDNGFKVGLHTNGSNFKLLKQLCPYLSFVGMDIKTSKRGYREYILPKFFFKSHYQKILKSLEFIVNNISQYDIRTTYYPEYITSSDIEEVAQMLQSLKVEKYTIQRYRGPNNYGIEYITKIKELQRISHKYVSTELRGL